MAITTSIARGYAWRMIIIAGVCAVLGAWGLYDYVIAIPRDQQLHDRRKLLELCQAALQTEQIRNELSPEAQQAREEIQSEFEEVIRRNMAQLQPQDQGFSTQEQLQERLNEIGQTIQSSGDADWLRLLAVIVRGLEAQRHLPLTEEAYPDAHAAFQTTQRTIESIGEVTAPGKYDRITQWAFISCLPFAPYFIWRFIRTRRQVYVLDDEGSLHMPGRTWQAREISDIDMKRWMAKSIAHVVHTDGTRVKLDDYLHRNLHLIIGAIASRLYPEAWDAEAKPIKRGPETDAVPEAGTAEPSSSVTSDSPSATPAKPTPPPEAS
ncbi:MAG: hypothetical protein ACYS0G_07565 [Planctomycetota bacterium]|jgi:hypothetical protein